MTIRKHGIRGVCGGRIADDKNMRHNGFRRTSNNHNTVRADEIDYPG